MLCFFFLLSYFLFLLFIFRPFSFSFSPFSLSAFYFLLSPYLVYLLLIFNLFHSSPFLLFIFSLLTLSFLFFSIFFSLSPFSLSTFPLSPFCLLSLSLLRVLTKNRTVLVLPQCTFLLIKEDDLPLFFYRTSKSEMLKHILPSLEHTYTSTLAYCLILSQHCKVVSLLGFFMQRRYYFDNQLPLFPYGCNNTPALLPYFMALWLRPAGQT